MVTLKLGSYIGELTVPRNETAFFLGLTCYNEWSMTQPQEWEGIMNGLEAIERMANHRHVKPELVTHDAPSEIITPEQEIDFHTFYRRVDFAWRQADGSFRFLSADIDVKKIRTKKGWSSSEYRWEFNPIWHEITPTTTVDNDGAYVAEVCDDLVKGYPGYAIGYHEVDDENGRKQVVLEMYHREREFRVIEGQLDEQGRFHVTKLTDEVVTVDFPEWHDIASVLSRFVAARFKEAQAYLKQLLPKGCDVAEVWNVDETLLGQYVNGQVVGNNRFDFGDVFLVDRKDKAGKSNSLLVRVSAGNRIRCPSNLKGRLIGKGGERIREIHDLHDRKQDFTVIRGPRVCDVEDPSVAMF